MSSVLGEFRPEQCVSLERRFVAAPLKLLVSVHIVPSLVGSGNAQTHLPCDALVKVDGNLSRCTITRLHLNTDHRHCCLPCAAFVLPTATVCSTCLQGVVSEHCSFGGRIVNTCQCLLDHHVTVWGFLPEATEIHVPMLLGVIVVTQKLDELLNPVQNATIPQLKSSH